MHDTKVVLHALKYEAGETTGASNCCVYTPCVPLSKQQKEEEDEKEKKNNNNVNNNTTNNNNK